MNHPIEKILNTDFEPISLSQMEHVKLMDRTDTKFTFHISLLEEILAKVKSDYYVLQIAQKTICKYETLYYDTNNFDLYLKHQSGKLNRYKIRHRTYLESNIGFLEVKFKNNKGRTIKDRIGSQKVNEPFDEKSMNFLQSKLPFQPQTLLPAVWVKYSRITLVSRHSQERVTIDINMEFANDKSTSKLYPLVIAEVKQGTKIPSVFLRTMKSLHQRAGSLSKYCMAIAFLNTIKANSFKEKLINIHKILNYDHTASISR